MLWWFIVKPAQFKGKVMSPEAAIEDWRYKPTWQWLRNYLLWDVIAQSATHASLQLCSALQSTDLLAFFYAFLHFEWLNDYLYLAFLTFPAFVSSCHIKIVFHVLQTCCINRAFSLAFKRLSMPLDYPVHSQSFNRWIEENLFKRIGIIDRPQETVARVLSASAEMPLKYASFMSWAHSE